MPSALGGIMGIMKPLMSAIGPMASALGPALGIAGAPFTGGASLIPGLLSAGTGLASGLMGSMTGQAAAAPTIKAPALSSAPIGPPATPDIPGPAGSGLSLSVPGAGATPGTGAGPNTDMTNLIAQAIGTGGGGSPFSAFGG